MTTKIQTFLASGCGRCNFFDTPQCKVHAQRETVEALRALLLNTELVETMKWGFPTYTFHSKNVVMIGVFKTHTVLSFFKGSLLKNHQNLLQKAGEHSHIARVLVLPTVEEVMAKELEIMELLQEAIQIERSEQKIETKAPEIDIPEELKEAFLNHPAFQEAFFKLTPGKQRGYLIFFTGAKQSSTRKARIESKMEAILKGEGMQDNYKNHRKN